MTGDLTTEWTHEIKKVKYDTIDDKRIKRVTRISITFRTVRDELQENQNSHFSFLVFGILKILYF